ncbi:hypothetical protein, partial [Staphylococcus equorum]|uniref:hypothetical protein n=1 Tax=Staphylococcus equorum TaxID=246432 RepID=UPI0025526E01
YPKSPNTSVTNHRAARISILERSWMVLGLRRVRLMTKMKKYDLEISWEIFVEEQIEAESMEDAKIIAREIAEIENPACLFPRIRVEEIKEGE